MFLPTSNAVSSVVEMRPFARSSKKSLMPSVEALSAGLDGKLDRLRIGGEEIGRAHGVDELPHAKAQLCLGLLVDRRRLDRVLEKARVREVGALDRVEARVVCATPRPRSAGRSSFAIGAAPASPGSPQPASPTRIPSSASEVLLHLGVVLRRRNERPVGSCLASPAPTRSAVPNCRIIACPACEGFASSCAGSFGDLAIGYS